MAALRPIKKQTLLKRSMHLCVDEAHPTGYIDQMAMVYLPTSFSTFCWPKPKGDPHGGDTFFSRQREGCCLHCPKGGAVHGEKSGLSRAHNATNKQAVLANGLVGAPRLFRCRPGGT